MHKMYMTFQPSFQPQLKRSFPTSHTALAVFSCLVFAGCWLYYPDPAQASGDGEQTEGVEEVHAARRYQWLQPADV